MDLGQDDPIEHEALLAALQIIDSIGDMLRQFVSDPNWMHREGSELAQLAARFPDPHVDIRRTVERSVQALWGCLQQTKDMVRNGVYSPQVLATMCRTVLLASCRLLVIFGPDNQRERETNAIRVMLQECNSLGRLYKRASQFKELTRLVPPPPLLASFDQRYQALKSQGSTFREGEMVGEAARIVGTRLSAFTDKPAPRAHAEQMIWLFNTYSGVAHAYAWPHMVPGASRDLPGFFGTDLHMIASVASVAIDRLRAAAA